MIPSLAFPAIHASHAGIWMAKNDANTGEIICRSIGKGEAISLVCDTPTIMLNTPAIAQRLGYADINGLDILELFAFIHPAQFMVPTPRGLARKLDLLPNNIETGEVEEHINDDDIAPLLLKSAQKLLSTLQNPKWAERDGSWNSAQSLSRLKWPWGAVIVKNLPKPERAEKWLFSKLSEWEEQPPRGKPRTITLPHLDILEQLDELTGAQAEERPGQRILATKMGDIFTPRDGRDGPNMLLAEAGTGIGKTLAYLAPATLWSAASGGNIWISTYTKALQRQLTSEAKRAYRDHENFKHRVVVRKGRENYLCLLNLEDALQGGFAGRAAILAQLVARWAAYSKDGDMIGGDLPGWLVTLFRRNGTNALTDRRGECVYAGCAHYRKCFIEKSVRASHHADIVIANHALVMVNAARAADNDQMPKHIIFDEGHHIFDAADSMFAADLTGQEAIELRRWILGPEGKSGRGSSGRRRGLAARLADISSYDDEGGRAIAQACHAAEALTADNWLSRIAEGQPSGPFEILFSAVRDMVFARDESSNGHDAGYGLETELTQLSPALTDAIPEAIDQLEAIVMPLQKLGKRLEAILAESPDWMDAMARQRAEGALASLGWRIDLINSWISLLSRATGMADPDFVDWLAVARVEGREYDIGIHRHWLDPTKPVSEVVLKNAHGVAATSATLKAGGDWDDAMARTGAHHLQNKVHQFEAQSPFNYAERAEVFIITDVKRGDLPALARAYGRLIEASRGGALGLFTAIRRLKSVHARIADHLARNGLPLYAQHIDPIDTGTLVDIFRDDPHSSLLGTDALRDGVDVPGRSLRMVIMEQVPWPRPDILHKARRLAFGGNEYDDRIIRARLAQAFGRLIRRADDHGHFILLSPSVPSRLLNAFPSGTIITRLTLDEAVEKIKNPLSIAPDLRHINNQLL
ncbi:ATP-dependent DNA helicase [Sphingorhabdus lutea]|uniref:ATP-dependent DNA helicase n=1 Tax=Sphingorhabdus lutea TaxID=1913578 RepID=UPI0009F959A4|nr:ATP-dependent DNA helicase [Sphingorhabdus lutea]